jgi:hypothetical protein
MSYRPRRSPGRPAQGSAFRKGACQAADGLPSVQGVQPAHHTPKITHRQRKIPIDNPHEPRYGQYGHTTQRKESKVMPQEVTIAGETFTIEPRFAEGHVLSTNEASTLNQTFYENVRNNNAKWISEAKENGSFDQDEAQAHITKYAEEYEFGARRGPGAPRDPVMSLAFKDCRRAVLKAVVEKYGKDHGFSPEDVAAKTNQILSGPKGERFVAQAREKIELDRKAAADLLNEDIAA